IQQGVNAAAPGATIAAAAGTYAEDVFIDNKPVKLWGRCPSLVSVVGDSAKKGAVTIYFPGANKSEVHHLAVTGQSGGILVLGANDVVVSGVWIHDTGEEGIRLDDSSGPASLSVTGSLVEGAHNYGMGFLGTDATIEESVVRDTKAGTSDP